MEAAFLNHIADLPDPEAAERFLRTLAEKHPGEHDKLLANAGLLSDVATLASFSPLLAATLLQNPDYLWWLDRRRLDSGVRSRDDLLESLGQFSMTHSTLEPGRRLRPVPTPRTAADLSVAIFAGSPRSPKSPKRSRTSPTPYSNLPCNSLSARSINALGRLSRPMRTAGSYRRASASRHWGTRFARTKLFVGHRSAFHLLGRREILRDPVNAVRPPIANIL